MARKSTRINTAIDEKTKAELVREAKERKVSVGWIVREAIETRPAKRSKEQAA